MGLLTDSEMDRYEERMNIIGQNGNDGLHYDDDTNQLEFGFDADVAARTKSGELEFMVEATRWLNEGYHEKYSFLLEEDVHEAYSNEDYM